MHEASGTMVGTRQFDEEQVLATALDVFWRRGLTATTMAEIAAATGVQRGSLYNAYGEKERIFLLAFDRYAARFLGAVREALSEPDLVRALDRFFDVAIANMTSGVPPRGCLTTKTATEAAHTSDRVQARVRRLLDDLEALASDSLSNPVHVRRLVAPPAVTARLIVTFTRGLAVMECAYGDPGRLYATARAFAATLVRPA